MGHSSIPALLPALLLLFLSLRAHGSYSRGSLPPILELLNGTIVTTSSLWAARRAEMAALLQSTMYGTFPTGPPPALTAVTLTNTSSSRGYEVSWVNASFATPGPGCATEFEVVRPAHCTAASPCPVSMMSREHRRWNVVAASRGYVAINYNGGDNGCDSPACAVVDPTRCFADAYPGATFALIARRAYLASRVLDAVCSATLPYADCARVGIAGHSRNGKQSLIAAGFDARFSAVVDSSSGAAGIAPYRLSGGDAQGERPASEWPGPWWLPSLRGYDGEEDRMPVDAHCIGGLIAPRPLLLAMATNDGVLSTFSVEAAADDVRSAYAFLGAPTAALAIDYRPGDHHGYEAVSRYIDFYDAAFGYAGPATAPPAGVACGALCAAKPFSRPSAAPHIALAGSVAGGVVGGVAGGAAGSVASPPAGGVAGPFHAFSWNAWDAAQGPDKPVPSANATSLERIAWVLGAAPASGPVNDPGGTYPPASDLLYVDELQLHTREAPAGVVRQDCALGGNIISGALFYREDMRTRTPPTPAGWPAVVWLHGPVHAKGYEAPYATDSMGMPGALADASFVVLAYEQLGYGLRLEEGANFYARHVRWSKLGAAVHDAMSAVDVLSADPRGFHPAGAPDALLPFPRVDPARIFLAGYSVGGAVALFAAALDARVAGVAAVSAWTPLRTDTDARPSGGIRRWWQLHATLPRLGWFADGAPAPLAPQAALPFDYDDVLRAVAPRPVYVHTPLRDRMNNATEVASTCAALRTREGYSALECASPPGVNALDATARAAVTQWLEKQAAARA